MNSTASDVQKKCGCGPCGSAETYAAQVRMPIAGRVRCIDKCIHDIIAALNTANLPTLACCCGHGKLPGRITLQDGRELMFFRNGEDFKVADEKIGGSYDQRTPVP